MLFDIETFNIPVIAGTEGINYFSVTKKINGEVILTTQDVQDLYRNGQIGLSGGILSQGDIKYEGEETTPGIVDITCKLEPGEKANKVYKFLTTD